MTLPRINSWDSCFTESSQSPYRQTGLTDSPQADTASPAARILRAAFMSRSWITPHSGQVHSRTFKGREPMVYPQSLHRLLDGYQRSIPINVRPYQSALYSSCLTNSDQLASEIDFARQWFFCMLLTARLSTAITWFSFISHVESLWRKSFRASAILAWIRATFCFAFVRLEEPFFFFAKRLCSLASLSSFFLNIFGDSIFSPVDRIAKCVNPRSIPTCPSTSVFALTESSQSMATKYRPEQSLDTVQVVTLAAVGIERDQRIFNGSSIFARRNFFPSHLNPLVVYSADCFPSFFLKVGYSTRCAKKFPKADWRCLNDCWTGMQLTSLSHLNSGFSLSLVSRAEVSW